MRVGLVGDGEVRVLSVGWLLFVFWSGAVCGE